jgi:hypothetical protein
MDLRRPLTDQELLHLIQQGLSDTQGFSNDNGETDEDSHIKEGNLVYLRFHQLTWDYPSKNTTNWLRMKKMYLRLMKMSMMKAKKVKFQTRLKELSETNLCIDEQMISFKGHINIKQYIKNKPTKWGIKLFAP